MSNSPTEDIVATAEEAALESLRRAGRPLIRNPKVEAQRALIHKGFELMEQQDAEAVALGEGWGKRWDRMKTVVDFLGALAATIPSVYTEDAEAKS